TRQTASRADGQRPRGAAVLPSALLPSGLPRRFRPAVRGAPVTVEYPVMPEPPTCVFCRRRPMDPAWRPFCSERCKVQDLARWADGTYAVPGDSVSADNDDDDRAGETKKPGGKRSQ